MYRTLFQIMSIISTVMSSDTTIGLPPDGANWTANDFKKWPRITCEDLVDYLVTSKAYDGREMKAFRSLYAYNYVQNGWLGNILSCTNDNVHYLKAEVSPSQPGVGRTDYSAWLAVGNDCTILTGHCTCPAGEGKSCSHIAAIAYAVSLAWTHGVAGETCTDRERLWGRGARKSALQSRFEEIDFSRPKADKLLSKHLPNKGFSGLPPIKQILDHADLERHSKESCSSILWACKGTMLNKIVCAKGIPVCEKQSLNHANHNTDGSGPVKDIQCKPCKDFYEKFVDLSIRAMESIRDDTSSQSSELWQNARRLRITSSKVNSLPKTKRADPNKFVTNQIYPRFKGNAATQHGLKHEAEGRTWFENMTGEKVSLTGVVIDNNEPYIAASPDGLVGNTTIIEIKCPTKPLGELIEGGKYDAVFSDGSYRLNPKGRNGFFAQVQMAMHCTGRNMCKFVVWTKSEGIIVDVLYDQSFVRDMLIRVRKFYFQHLLVCLVDENHFNRLKLCDKYKHYCQL